jgi:ubiquinone/menaquinone biosynthesis C-methylase UbiE
MKKDTSWGNVAGWYFEHLASPDSYHKQVILPNLVRVMNIIQGEYILDIACGTGFFSDVFNSFGAKVRGIDISPELIRLAKEHASSQITFEVGSAHELKNIKSKSIDKIACVLAIQNIKEVKEMFAECARVLKPMGKIYIVMNHPAFRIPGGSSWGHDPLSKQQYRRIDYYLSEKKIDIAMHPGNDPEEKTVSFHRSLQYYFKLMASSGFAISRFEEWISHKNSEPGPRQKEEDRMRKEIPLFLCLEAIIIR